MVFCDNCGAVLDENVKFCGACGARVSQPVFSGAETEIPEDDAVPAYVETGLFKAYGKFWKGITDFKGYTGRSDFWYVVLMQTIILTVFGGIYGIVLSTVRYPYQASWVWELAGAAAIFCIVPTAAIFSRRLRDINRKGISELLYLIPFAGIVFFCIYNFKAGADNKRLCAYEADGPAGKDISRASSVIAAISVLLFLPIEIISNVVAFKYGTPDTGTVLLLALEWALSAATGVCLLLKDSKGSRIALLCVYGILFFKGLWSLISILMIKNSHYPVYLKAIGLAVTASVLLLIILAVAKKDTCRKIWFVPVVLDVLYTVLFILYTGRQSGFEYFGDTVASCLISMSVSIITYFFIGYKFKNLFEES